MTLEYDIFETSAGWVGAVASEKGLRRTTLPLDTPQECAEELGVDLDAARSAPPRFEGLKRKIDLHLRGAGLPGRRADRRRRRRAVPSGGMASRPYDTGGRDPQLPVAGGPGRTAPSRPRGGTEHGSQPAVAGSALPSRRGQRRRPGRLRQGRAQAAWRAARTIPAGETRSYQWLAAQAGRPRAARAAGQSMARNRLWLVVPCHRVVASDGGLGGYGRDASDLTLKQRLLDMEEAQASALTS